MMNWFMVWLTDVRDPHHREFPTRREQDLNLRRTWVKQSCAVVVTIAPWTHISIVNVSNFSITVYVLSIKEIVSMQD